MTAVLHHTHKNNSKKIKDINIRPETIELLKENLGNDIDLGDNFSILKPRAKAMKAKINKWNYIILKIFCTAKENHQQNERQPTEWEKIFVNHTPDKELMSKTCKRTHKIQ